MNKRLVFKIGIIVVSVICLIVGVPLFAVGCSRTTCVGVDPKADPGTHWTCGEAAIGDCLCTLFDDSTGSVIMMTHRERLSDVSNAETFVGGFFSIAGIAASFGAAFVWLKKSDQGGGL